jgi:hypothetical protein
VREEVCQREPAGFDFFDNQTIHYSGYEAARRAVSCGRHAPGLTIPLAR